MHSVNLVLRHRSVVLTKGWLSADGGGVAMQMRMLMLMLMLMRRVVSLNAKLHQTFLCTDRKDVLG